jgi:uncharacterized lipoprotein
MQKFLILGLLAIVLLSACAAPATDQQVSDEGQSPLVTVYRSPT